jgi:hypothetical protein
MKKIHFLLTALLFALTHASFKAQTTLAAGDILFTSYNGIPAAGTAPDTFSFVVLTPISSSTTIYFTERGYQGGTAWQASGSTEGTISLVTSSSLSIGAEVQIAGLGAGAATLNGTSVGTVAVVAGGNPTTGLSLSNAGDQIIAFQNGGGDPAAGGATMIAGINWALSCGTTSDAGWNGSGCTYGPQTSVIPPGLTGGTNAFLAGTAGASPNNDHAKFNCSGAPYANAAAIRTAVMNKANWQFGGATGTTTFNIPPGCTYISTCTVPPITVHPLSQTFCPNTNASLSAGASGTGISFQWQVDMGSGFINLSNGAAYSGVTTSTLMILGITNALNGYIYHCVITNACGNSITNNATVTVPTISGTITKNDPTCNLFSNGNATVSPSGGRPPYTYSWTPVGGTGVTGFGLSQGNYTCTIKDMDNCTGTATTTISQPPPITRSSSTTSTCYGGSTGTATISNVSGGTPGYTYNWQPIGGNAATATGLYQGSFTCTITDANGCMAYEGVNITQDPQITSTVLSYTYVPCPTATTGAATVSASGPNSPFTYSWSPTGGTGATGTGLSAGIYTCTITNAIGCTKAETVAINVWGSGVGGTATTTSVSCFGGNNGAINLTPSGATAPYTYQWLPSGPTTEDRTNLTQGTYSVQITSSEGCTGTVTVAVNQPSPLAANISKTDVTCSGGSNGTATVSSITGGSAPYNYSWSPGGGTGTSISGLVQGTYTCTITDFNSCTLTKTVTVSPSTVSVSGSATVTNVTCNLYANGNATITPSGGSAPYTYSWTPSGGTAATAYGLSQGTYTCAIRDANNCTGTATATISQPPPITYSSSSTGACYGGSNGTATISNVSGGTPGYTYSWSPIGGNAATGTGLYQGTYTCTITDANGCVAYQAVTVLQGSPLATNVISYANVTCAGGNNGSATVTVSGGSLPYTYSWSPTGGTGATATGLSQGTYTFTVTDALNCVKTETVTISQTGGAVTGTAAVTNVSCFGGSNGTINLTPSGGTGPYTFNWLPSGPTTEDRTGLSQGTYSVQITDANGCTGTVNAMVAAPSLLSASSSATAVVCNGGSSVVTVNAGGGTTPYTGTGNTFETAGSYTYTVTDANGCTATTNITITEPAVLSASSSAGSIVCNGGSSTVTVNASGGTAAYTGTGTFTETAGSYTYTVTDANGCTATTSIVITEPAPLASSQTYTLCPGGSVTVGMSTYTTSGIYTNVLTSVNGCDSTVTTDLTVNTAIVTNQSVSLCGGQTLTVGTNTYTASGSYTDVLTAANGCDSTVNTTLTVAAQILLAQNPTLCAGESITVGMHTYSVSGTYVDTLTAVAGCDSIVTTHLTAEPAIDNTTTVNAETITANASGASYQWIDCDNGGVVITTETNQSFTATANGNYAVILTYNSCSDTSACVNISSVGLHSTKEQIAVKLYPNPSAGVFTLELRKDATITITNALGAQVLRESIRAGAAKIDLHAEADGVYFMNVQSEGKTQILKIIKQD